MMATRTTGDGPRPLARLDADAGHRLLVGGPMVMSSTSMHVLCFPRRLVTSPSALPSASLRPMTRVHDPVVVVPGARCHDSQTSRSSLSSSSEIRRHEEASTPVRPRTASSPGRGHVEDGRVEVLLAPRRRTPPPRRRAAAAAAAAAEAASTLRAEEAVPSSSLFPSALRANCTQPRRGRAAATGKRTRMRAVAGRWWWSLATARASAQTVFTARRRRRRRLGELQRQVRAVEDEVGHGAHRRPSSRRAVRRPQARDGVGRAPREDAERGGDEGRLAAAEARGDERNQRRSAPTSVTSGDHERARRPSGRPPVFVAQVARRRPPPSSSTPRRGGGVYQKNLKRETETPPPRAVHHTQ